MGRLGTTRFRAGEFTHLLAFSPNGKILASQGSNGQYQSGRWLWDAATGQALHDIAVDAPPWSTWKRQLAFSPDGNVLFTGCAEGSPFNFRLIEVPSGKLLRNLENSRESTAKLYVGAFSPDGRSLAAAGGDIKRSRIVFWDVATGKVQKELKGGERDFIESIAFSPDGKILATGSHFKRIWLWDLATEKVIKRLEATDKEPVQFLAFAASGKVLASLGMDWRARLWDVATGNMRQELKGDSATMTVMAFSRDGRFVASGGSDGTIHLWEGNSGKELRAWRAHRWDIDALAFSPDGKILASTGRSDCAIRRWDFSAGKEIDAFAGNSGIVEHLRAAPDGKTMLAWGRDGRVVEWDLTTFQDRGRLFRGSMGPTERGWRPQASDLSWGRNLLAMVGNWETGDGAKQDSVIRLFDIATGKETGTPIIPAKDGIQTLKFSPDGNLLASIGETGTRLWDMAAAKELHYLKGSGDSYYAPPAFSPNGNLLALMVDDVTKTDIGKTIRLWDIAAGKEVRRWDSRQRHVVHLLFAPDGRSLVSVAPYYDATNAAVDIRVWETETGTQLTQLRGRKGEKGESKSRFGTSTTALAFSPSGRVLAISGGIEKGSIDSAPSFELHLFETISGQEIRQIDAPQGTVYSLAFGADGRTLASGGADSTILLWDLTGQATTGASKPVPLTAKALEQMWSDLAATDAARGDQAIWALVFSPKQCLPLLKERVLAKPAPAEQAAKLIADLDSETFAVRQKAAKALDDLGEAAEAAVRKALGSNPALEVRERLEQFLKKRDTEVIRRLRAIEVLEQIGTAEARQVLDALAKGSTNPRVLEAAKAALDRHKPGL